MQANLLSIINFSKPLAGEWVDIVCEGREQTLAIYLVSYEKIEMI